MDHRLVRAQTDPKSGQWRTQQQRWRKESKTFPRPFSLHIPESRNVYLLSSFLFIYYLFFPENLLLHSSTSSLLPLKQATPCSLSLSHIFLVTTRLSSTRPSPRSPPSFPRQISFPQQSLACHINSHRSESAVRFFGLKTEREMETKIKIGVCVMEKKVKCGSEVLLFSFFVYAKLRFRQCM